MSLIDQNELHLQKLRGFWPNNVRGRSVADHMARSARRYQACELPQCGQPTEVETAAWKMKPHPHEYIA